MQINSLTGLLLANWYSPPLQQQSAFFSLLTNSFSEQQTSALEDSIEASISFNTILDNSEYCKLSTMIKNFVLNFGHYR